MNAATIEIKISENAIQSVQVGTEATIEVGSAGITGVSGIVASVNPVADDQGMFLAKIYVENKEGILKGGMLADVKLATAMAEEALVIPAEALLADNADRYVYVVNGNQAEKRKIELGLQNDQEAQVTSGLSENDRIVVKGKDFIKSDSVLKISE